MSLVEISNLQGGEGTVQAAPKASKSATAAKGVISVDAIVALVKKHPKGVGGDVLRRVLGAAKPAFYYQMNKALAEKRVRKTGVKRSTLYFAGK